MLHQKQLYVPYCIEIGMFQLISPCKGFLNVFFHIDICQYQITIVVITLFQPFLASNFSLQHFLNEISMSQDRCPFISYFCSTYIEIFCVLVLFRKIYFIFFSHIYMSLMSRHIFFLFHLLSFLIFISEKPNFLVIFIFLQVSPTDLVATMSQQVYLPTLHS